MEIDGKAVGKRLKEAIDASGKTRDQVGAAAGVKAGTIQRWQAADQEPRAFEFARACLSVGATPDAILGISPLEAAQLDRPVLPPAERGYLAALRRLTSKQRAAVLLLTSDLVAGRMEIEAGSERIEDRGRTQRPMSRPAGKRRTKGTE